MAAQKSHAGSTQKFIEVKDIADNVVVLEGGYAATVIEIQATNFALLSRDEQNTRVFAYASLLNSLAFPIQIIVQNKRVDLTSYLKLLDEELIKRQTLPETDPTKATQKEKFTAHMKLYREFVQELIKVNTVLDKKFYIVISYSTLEKGAAGATATLKGNSDASFLASAKASLNTKAESLHTQLGRLSLRARTLGKEELIKLFYGIYNEQSFDSGSMVDSIDTPIVKGGQ